MFTNKYYNYFSSSVNRQKTAFRTAYAGQISRNYIF